MNYFEFHIGDHAEATAHLSFTEDGALGRLLRKYYATERPLPADLKTVQRLVGARTKEEREAVETVLQEFFELQNDGWHQSRCDAEIATFHEKQAGKEGAKEGAKERQRRARERRKILFEQLRGHDQVPAYTTTTVELEAMLSRVTGAPQSRNVTQPVTRDDTATQTPDSKHQTPDPREEVGPRKRVASPIARPDDVARQVWDDWERLRRTKKAPITETVMKEARCEAAKAGLSFERFLEVWCARGSQGLQADWLKPSERGAQAGRHTGFADRNYEGAPDGSIPA
ncbi:YdaU family protein [Variovorax guangxiensis]|uniref:YdaU family protein n=1 Tax=Variovorax guangxiensis TaxID=1775474 RepID=UPI00286749FD|nr:YdaU family protein [Variovorax guangxiensis]MDR6857230.1 uncharacterized protein YdaU (DUF1376 family) [Variovorax guangxiensis]